MNRQSKKKRWHTRVASAFFLGCCGNNKVILYNYLKYIKFYLVYTY